MSDTNINAYYMDVDEALKKVRAAQAEYEAAMARLETKKHEEGLTEEAVAPAEDEEEADPKEPKKTFSRR